MNTATIESVDTEVNTFGRESEIVDPKKAHEMSTKVHDHHLKLAALKSELETNIQFCLQAGIEWFEVDVELIRAICNGKFPDAGYMIYKNVKLCPTGKSEEIARREQLTIHEILFKDDKLNYRVGKANV